MLLLAALAGCAPLKRTRARVILMMVLMIAVVGFLTGCAGGLAARDVVSPGQIKVSFFQLTRGRMAKVPVGVYVAMISAERNLRYGLKLNEIFEEINTPRVMVVDDETAGELFKFLNHEEFFALQETPLDRININELKRPDYFTKVISVEANGILYSVCYDNLSQFQKEKFNAVQQAIFLFMTAAAPKAAIEVQDWRDLLPPEIEK